MFSRSLAVVFVSFVAPSISIDICKSSEVILGRQIPLSGSKYGDNLCECIVRVPQTNSTVEVKQNGSPIGCLYQLEFQIGNTTTIYNCNKFPGKRHSKMFYLGSEDILYVTLKKHSDNATGFKFSLTLTLNVEGNLKMFCYELNVTFSEPSTSSLNTSSLAPELGSTVRSTASSTDVISTTRMSSPGTTATEHTPSVGDTDIRITGSATVQPNSLTGITTGSVTILSKQFPTSTSTQSLDVSTTNQLKKQDDSNTRAVTIGSAVGGSFLVIICVVIGLICFLKNRKHGVQRGIKHESNGDNVYRSTMADENGSHIENNNQEMEIIPNDLYWSSNTIKDGDNCHLENHNKKVEIEIIPNDLYVSSDTLADEVGSHLGNDNKEEEMEIIPNDLYWRFSGDEIDQSVSSPFSTAEYAVVQKKPQITGPVKQLKEVNPRITRIVGPKGDNYTLVNKC